MLSNYKNEIYKDWLTVHGIKFKRKLENETAFDGIVKIYSISSDNENINKTIQGLFFGKLAEPTESGILLRAFINKNSWPKTCLTHLNMTDNKLIFIKESKSSYDTWTVTKIGIRKYQIQLSPTETVDYTDV